jgi:hypothetical protein
MGATLETLETPEAMAQSLHRGGTADGYYTALSAIRARDEQIATVLDAAISRHRWHDVVVLVAALRGAR